MFPGGADIVPLSIEMAPRMVQHLCQAVPITRWLCRCPECEIPGSAVCPLPGALNLNVVASQPGNIEAESSHSLQDEVDGCI